jgi:hypothetical protein
MSGAAFNFRKWARNWACFFIFFYFFHLEADFQKQFRASLEGLY